MELRRITSREYKVMLDQRAFTERKLAIPAFLDELRDLAASLGVAINGDFETTEKRRIQFLDTSDLTLVRSGVVLRQREEVESEEVQYTLKCRSEDRYVANGTDVRAAAGLKGKGKFEEDIAAPFLSRYSHSNTVAPGGDSNAPENLAQATEIFPLLGTLQRDGAPCSPDTRLVVVNGVQASERVFTGPEAQFGGKKANGRARAELALILWSREKKGRPLVAEFSFRYKDEQENFSPAVAQAAKKFYELFQRLDWCRPSGITKTQYVYRGGQGD